MNFDYVTTHNLISKLSTKQRSVFTEAELILVLTIFVLLNKFYLVWVPDPCDVSVPGGKKVMETAKVQKARVAVIGAGITGLSVSLCLAQQYRDRAEISVIAERYSPYTTSDSSGGLVIPSFSSYGTRERGKQAGEVVNERLQRWAYVTYDHLRRLREGGVRPEDGLMLVPTYKYFEDWYPVPDWANHVINFKSLDPKEAAALGLRADLFKTVWSFETFVIDGKRFLPWMAERVAEMGGVFETRKVTSLSDLGDYDVVVNCTGQIGRAHV